jgi:hypothetical protein
VKILIDALPLLWRRKGACLGVACLLAGLPGWLTMWLSLKVATTWDLALHALILIAALGFLAFAAMLLKRAFLTPAPRRLFASPAFWLALAVFVVLGIWLPWKLIWWVPELASLKAQAASAAARFLTAHLLFSLVLSWLIASAGLHQPKEQ